MSAPSTLQLISFVTIIIALGWGGMHIWAALLAYRGRKYWATKLMLFGALFQTFGGTLYALGLAFFPYLASEELMRLAMVANAVVPLLLLMGIVFFLVGLVGLCARFRALEARSAELEQLNENLAGRIAE